LNSKRLQEIFQEAINDYGSADLSDNGYEARMKLGVKITRDLETNEVVIYDHSKSDYYVEMKDKNKAVVDDLGWYKGVLTLTLDKYKDKLERIKESIKKELNGGKSKKRLNYFKESREQILKKYYLITQKLQYDTKNN